MAKSSRRALRSAKSKTKTTTNKPNYKKRRLGAVGATAVLGGAMVGASMMGGDGSDGGTGSSKNNGKTPTETGVDGTGEGDGTGSGSGDGSSGDVKTKVVEVPIDNYEEAMEFANREWNKIKRNNGRTLECQVQGATEWMNGEWCKVYLPSFDIDGFMYITRVSQSSDGGDWSCNLTLVDYPPGWGKEELKSDEDDESSDSDDGGDSESSDSGGTGESTGGEGDGTGSESSTGESSGNSENSNKTEIGGEQYWTS